MELVTPVWAFIPIELFLAATSGFALRPIVFGITMHHWQLWQLWSIGLFSLACLLDRLDFVKAS